MTATVVPEVPEETGRVDPPPWKGRWVLYVIGTFLMAVGIRLILRNAHDWTPLADMGEWLVGGIVLHDAVLAPVVIAIGFVLRRALPSPWRGPIVSGLVVSAVLVVVAWPQLRGYKFAAGNPTIQPRDYTRGLLLAFAVVWGVVLVTEVVMIVRHRMARPPAPAPRAPARASGEDA